MEAIHKLYLEGRFEQVSVNLLSRFLDDTHSGDLIRNLQLLDRPNA